MRHVLWSVPARSDLEAIDDYWSAYSEIEAEIIAGKIERAAAFLSTMPRAGPVIRSSAARKWSVATTHYLLVYRVTDDAIQILRVYHASQDWTDEPWEEF